MLKRLLIFMNARRDARRLATLDDRMLLDIGISRSAIEATVAKGRNVQDRRVHFE
jgi:uncharacterized protein YjiS (DUF1127 family)